MFQVSMSIDFYVTSDLGCIFSRNGVFPCMYNYNDVFRQLILLLLMANFYKNTCKYIFVIMDWFCSKK